MTGRNFGRRTNSASAPVPMPVPAKFFRAGSSQSRAAPAVSVEDELKAWKRARGFSLALKPVALMASLCFGVASFALPAWLNEWLQYPLYALSAASLYMGFRRKRAKTASAP